MGNCIIARKNASNFKGFGNIYQDYNNVNDIRLHITQYDKKGNVIYKVLTSTYGTDTWKDFNGLKILWISNDGNIWHIKSENLRLRIDDTVYAINESIKLPFDGFSDKTSITVYIN